MAKTKSAPFRTTTANNACYFCVYCHRETVDAVLNRTEKMVMYRIAGFSTVWVGHAACWRKYVAQCEEKRRANV